jgi:hypothetical protein
MPLFLTRKQQQGILVNLVSGFFDKFLIFWVISFLAIPEAFISQGL